MTTLGEMRFRQFERTTTLTDKIFDIMFEEDGAVWLAGIPGRDDMKRLKTILANDGHIAVTTQDKRLKQEAVV